MISFLTKCFKDVRNYLQKLKKKISKTMEQSYSPGVEIKQQIPEQEVDKHHEEDTEDKGIFTQDRISFLVRSIPSSDASGFGCSRMFINPNLSRSSTPSFASSSTGSHPNASSTDSNDNLLEAQEYSCHQPDAIKTTFHRASTVLSSSEEFRSRYKEEKMLCKGGFGRVYAGERRSDSKPVAIKHIPKKAVQFVQVNCQGNVYHEILEVVLMEQAAGRLCDGSFENRAVIGLMETFILATEVIIVMERPPNTVDMFDYLNEVKHIPEGQAKVIFKQIVNTALLMHKNGVFHRDLKLENFLINQNQDTPEIRLIDFGCGDFVKHEPFRSLLGTSDFAPPECVRAETYKAEATTVWQIGVMLFMVWHTRVVFNTKVYMKEDNKVLENVSKECNDFLSQCLSLDPKQRPTLEDLLLHPWLE